MPWISLYIRGHRRTHKILVHNPRGRATTSSTSQETVTQVQQTSKQVRHRQSRPAMGSPGAYNFTQEVLFTTIRTHVRAMEGTSSFTQDTDFYHDVDGVFAPVERLV